MIYALYPYGLPRHSCLTEYNKDDMLAPACSDCTAMLLNYYNYLSLYSDPPGPSVKPVLAKPLNGTYKCYDLQGVQ